MKRSGPNFFIKLLTFAVLEILIIFGALFCWGFTGQVSAQRFKNMLRMSTPNEKQELADALNFYYNRGISRYTVGLLSRCEAETESLMNQFMWFHRNVASYYIFDDASYHEVLVSTLDYFDVSEEIDYEKVSTWYLERLLTNRQRLEELGIVTDKDKNSLLMSLLDTGGSLLLGSSHPIAWSVSALNLLHKAGSDPAKCVPAIIVFKKQRENKFMWTVGILTLLNSTFILQFLRRKKGK